MVGRFELYRAYENLLDAELSGEDAKVHNLILTLQMVDPTTMNHFSELFVENLPQCWSVDPSGRVNFCGANDLGPRVRACAWALFALSRLQDFPHARPWLQLLLNSALPINATSELSKNLVSAKKAASLLLKCKRGSLPNSVAPSGVASPIEVL